MHAFTTMRSRRWMWSSPLFAILLAACGSSSTTPDGGVPEDGAGPADAGGSQWSTTTVEVSVVWPDGPPPAGLTVVTSLGQAPVVSGAASATVLFEGPQLAAALDEAGRPVLLGFVGEAAPTLDAHSTAEVLLYFGAGVSFRPAHLRPEALAAIRTSSLADTLAGHVADALRADPTSLLSRTGTVVGRRDRLLRQARWTSVDVHKMVIDPSEPRSGITVLQPSFQNIALMNEYRRRAIAYVTREWYEPEGGGPRVPSPMEWTTVPIAPIKAATSVVGSIVDGLILGDYAWGPVTTDPIYVPLSPDDAEATGYSVLVVGPGLDYGAAYDELSTEQMNDLKLLVGQTVVMDFILPVLADVCIPIAGSSIDDYIGLSNANFLVQDTLNLLTRSAPGALTKAYEGDIVGGVGDIFLAVTTNASFRLGLAQLGFEAFVKNTTSATEDTFLAVVETLATAVTVVEVGLTVGDLALQAGHIALSNIAEEFEVIVTASRIDLAPPKLDVLVGERRWFEVVLHDPSISEAERVRIVYDWTCSSDAIDLEGIGNNAEVRGRRVGSAVVSVRATLDGVELGTAEGVVAVLDQTVEVVPRKVSLHPRESVALIAKLAETSTAVDYRYVWTVSGAHGVFRGGLTTVDSGFGRVEYLSNQDVEAHDRVRVQVFSVDPDGTRTSVGVGEAELLIEFRKTVMFGRFYVEVTIGDGFSGAHAYAIIPKVDEAVRYSVRGYDFYDWAYYGRAFSASYNVGGAWPRNWEDRPDEYWIGLSSGGGSCTPPCGPPYELIDWLTRRFAGMVVESTVTYP